MDRTDVRAAYNCVIAAVYNYMRCVHRLPATLDSFCLHPHFFRLYAFDGFLSPSPPNEIACDYLRRIGGEMTFPPVRDLDDAIRFIDVHLERSGVLPVNINLRYDILDPLPFDNDFWHFHLIIGRKDPNTLQMYDQFEDVFYEVQVDHLRKAIDTPFNYRMGKGFTPFMTITFADMEYSRSMLVTPGREERAIEEMVDGYPLADNTAIGRSFIRGLQRYLGRKPNEDDMYRLINFHQIILLSRRTVLDVLSMKGIIPLEAANQVYRQWEQYKNALGMALVRSSKEEYDRLEEQFQHAIDTEHAVLRGAGVRR